MVRHEPGRFAPPGFTAPDRLDFTVSASSPLAGRDLPTRRLDRQLADRIAAFFQRWGYDGGLEYADDPLAVER